MAAPPALHFTCNVVRGKQALEAVAAWLDGRPTTGLVVIDTLAKFRSLTVAGLSFYEQDYAAIGGLQRLALDRGVPIVAVCHTRKPKNGQAEAPDPLEEVNGSMGLTGAADVVLVLTRPRHGREGKLFVTGRDIEERCVPVAWNPDFCTWTQTADQDGPLLSDDQARAVAILEAAGRPLTIKQLTDNFGSGKSYEALKKMILRLASDGVLVKCAYGTYTTAENREEGQGTRRTASGRPDPPRPLLEQLMSLQPLSLLETVPMTAPNPVRIPETRRARKSRSAVAEAIRDAFTVERDSFVNPSPISAAGILLDIGDQLHTLVGLFRKFLERDQAVAGPEPPRRRRKHAA